MAKLTIAVSETDPITGECTHISATEPNYGRISLGFRRTSKVPDNGDRFWTPDLGPYLLYDVEKYRGLPKSILQAGGWFTCMRDNEAMYIDFDSSRKFKVTVGSDTSRKAHCVVLGRRYLDGLPDSVIPGCVRQFVAAPASPWYQKNSGDNKTVVDDLSLAIRPPKDLFSGSGIIVKTLAGAKTNVQVNNLTTVSQLKAILEPEFGVVENNQRILFCAKQLDDHIVLSSIGVVEGSIIYMLTKMRGGGADEFLAPSFARRKMILKPGGLVWQPEAYKEDSQTSWAETPAFIRIHILNAEDVRAWTGIDPPPSLVDPELYKSVGLLNAQDEEEFERLALKDAILHGQLYEYHHGKPLNTPPKQTNPYESIRIQNIKSQSGESRGEGSGGKIRWWRRIFR